MISPYYSNYILPGGRLVGTHYSGNLNEQIHYAPHESERSVFTQGIYGTFFDLGFKVQILDYYMNNWNEINNSIFNSGLKMIW